MTATTPGADLRAAYASLCDMLGATVRDKISGIEGVARAADLSLFTGHMRVGIVVYFDAQFVEVVTPAPLEDAA